MPVLSAEGIGAVLSLSDLLCVKPLPLAIPQVTGVRLHQVIAGENMIIWDDVPERYV